MKAALNNFISVSVLEFLLSSCSLHYTTADGINHYVGFMVIDSTEKKCTLFQSIESLGISVDLTKESGGLNIGRKIVTTANISPDSFVSFEDSDTNGIQLTEQKAGVRFCLSPISVRDGRCPINCV